MWYMLTRILLHTQSIFPASSIRLSSCELFPPSESFGKPHRRTRWPMVHSGRDCSHRQQCDSASGCRSRPLAVPTIWTASVTAHRTEWTFAMCRRQRKSYELWSFHVRWPRCVVHASCSCSFGVGRPVRSTSRHRPTDCRMSLTNYYCSLAPAADCRRRSLCLLFATVRRRMALVCLLRGKTTWLSWCRPSKRLGEKLRFVSWEVPAVVPGRPCWLLWFGYVGLALDEGLLRRDGEPGLRQG